MDKVELTQWEKVCVIFTYVLAAIGAVIGGVVCAFCIATAWYWILLAGFIGLMAGALLGTIVEIILWAVWGVPQQWQ